MSDRAHGKDFAALFNGKTGKFKTMDLTRRVFVSQLGKFITSAGALSLLPIPLYSQEKVTMGSKRPLPGDRKFHSEVIEVYIQSICRLIPNSTVSELFANCFPNTLDTTVQPGTFEGKPDTAVVTGDIAAMWLRDSSAQVWPYLPFALKDRSLRELLEGVIRRQVRCLLIDSYANCFMADLNAPPLIGSREDETVMKQGVGERKYELDSLCYPIRLAHGYWKVTGDTAPFDSSWKLAMQTILKTMRVEQRKDGKSPYRFQRPALNPTDSLVNGIGNPLRPIGLIASAFRPSDDACILPFLVPANLFAVTSLRQLATMSNAILQDTKMATEAFDLANEVEVALRQHAIVPASAGTIWAYEIDGYGGTILMDDANAPSLLSLPYLNSSPDAALYGRTRAFVWSKQNPWFFSGSAGEGVGGPHVGRDSIWPMSQIIYALTSETDVEIKNMIQLLTNCAVATGFVHESYNKNNSALFTRAWFAWANTLFGELIARTAKHDPALLS
ncbi:glycoside hydrolase family 125 protein [Granulicella sp. L46]|uniref:glycoside hydrolase family 125 protein n=1 Tax=Granulicella sp. L46 TaxID=1641865 RepID=UPI0020B16CD6|nr:glycoside hydrolase family 125 protein [Granulicella sp. L46]